MEILKVAQNMLEGSLKVRTLMVKLADKRGLSFDDHIEKFDKKMVEGISNVFRGNFNG